MGPGNTISCGNINANGSIAIRGMTINPISVSPEAGSIQFGDGTGWHVNFKNSANTSTLKVYDQGNIVVNNDVRCNSLSMGSTTIKENHLKNLIDDPTIEQHKGVWIHDTAIKIRLPGPGLYNITAFQMNNQRNRHMQATFYYNREFYKNALPFDNNLVNLNNQCAISLQMKNEDNNDTVSIYNVGKDEYYITLTRITTS
jgi:hypothetical protein